MDLKSATPSSGTLSGPFTDVGPLPRNAALEKPFLCKLVLGVFRPGEADRGVLLWVLSFTPSISMPKSGLAASDVGRDESA